MFTTIDCEITMLKRIFVLVLATAGCQVEPSSGSAPSRDAVGGGPGSVLVHIEDESMPTHPAWEAPAPEVKPREVDGCQGVEANAASEPPPDPNVVVDPELKRHLKERAHPEPGVPFVPTPSQRAAGRVHEELFANLQGDPSSTADRARAELKRALRDSEPQNGIAEP